MTTRVLIYCLQGVGRATFEGTLKAEFAEKFDDEEAAFGNIIFQNGLITTLGFVIAANNGCENVGDYCIAFHDERLHNVLVLEVIIVCFAVLAVAEAGEGPLRTRKEDHQKMQPRLLGENHLL